MNAETNNHHPLILKTERVFKNYRVIKNIFRKPLTIHAVQDVTLSIRKGETLMLIGESGSGKSTLARCILRLTDVTHGKIYFEGSEVSALTQAEFRPYRKKIQIVFQDSGNTFNPRIPIGRMLNEIIRLQAGTGTNETDAEIVPLIERVGLPGDCIYSYPHELSGGQRQRLGIARALSVDPSLLVCDEPVSALDLSVQAQILNLFMDLQEQRGLSYLFISHELPVIRFMADDIAVMYGGYIVERCGKNEWFTNPLHPHSRALMMFSGLNKSPAPETDCNQRRSKDSRRNNGCVYFDRCPRKIIACLSGMPEEREISPGHFIRCHVISG